VSSGVQVGNVCGYNPLGGVYVSLTTLQAVSNLSRRDATASEPMIVLLCGAESTHSLPALLHFLQ
jgi:hypothetical protein